MQRFPVRGDPELIADRGGRASVSPRVLPSTITVADLVEVQVPLAQRDVLARRAVHAATFGVAGRYAQVHFDDEAGAQALARRYADLPGLGVLAVPVYAVHSDGGVLFWAGAEQAYRWDGDLGPENRAFFADILATHALLSSIPQGVSLHAAALRIDAAAFALTGRSEAGKSTTAMACVAGGAQLYSDERCVTVAGEVLAYPRAVNLRRGGTDLLLSALPDVPLRDRLGEFRGRDQQSIPFATLFGDEPFPAPAPLRALFAVAGRGPHAASTRVTPVAMLRYAEAGASVPARGIDRVATVLAFLQRTACFELHLGPPDATAEHILARVAEVCA